MPAICPGAALQQYVEAVRTCHWDMGRGYLCPVIDVGGPVEAAKREVAMTPQLMTKRLKAHAGIAGQRGQRLHHAFVSGRCCGIPSVKWSLGIGDYEARISEA